MKKSMTASIEVSPKQAPEFEDLSDIFPAETRVYIADIGIHPNKTLVAAAKLVARCGYRTVPHIASRRLKSRAILEERLKAYSGEANINDALIIGGDLDQSAGPFASTMDVLETGLLDQCGITQVAVAGHPEGAPSFPQDAALKALKRKQEYGERTAAQIRIVTQFGFDPKPFILWAEALASRGVDLPVHLGVAGPATLKMLIKFAAMCGVGSSLGFLRKRASSIARLASRYSPEEVVAPIENHRMTQQTPVRQMHVFPFGGLRKSVEWLRNRNSWQRPAPHLIGRQAAD